MSVEDLKPKTIVSEALRSVPVVKYALGLAAIAIFLAVIRTATQNVGVGMFPLMAGMLLLMVLLIVVAAAARNNGGASLPAMFLVWVVVLFITVFLSFTVSAVLIGKPEQWARIILPPSVVDKPLIAVGPTEPRPTPTPSVRPSAESSAVPEHAAEAPRPVPSAVSQSVGGEKATSPTDLSAGLRGISVFYYPKGKDASVMRNALRRLNVPFSERPAELLNPELTTNAIACSPDVPIEALRVIFAAFRSANLPIVNVRQFLIPGKKRRIEILSIAFGIDKATAVLPGNAPLTDAQLNALQSCPEDLMNEY